MFEPLPRLLLGLFTGFLFGVLLQKGRVAKYRVIVGQFLLRLWKGDDPRRHAYVSLALDRGHRNSGGVCVVREWTFSTEHAVLAASVFAETSITSEFKRLAQMSSSDLP